MTGNVRNTAFIAVIAAIGASLLITLGMMSLGVIPKNQVYLGNLAVPSVYEGSVLPRYRNAFENFRVSVSNTAAQQFPYYIKLLKADTLINLYANRRLYDTALDGHSFVPLKHISGADYFLSADNSLIVSLSHRPHAASSISESAELINGLDGPDVSVYCVANLSERGLLPKPYFAEHPDLSRGLLDKLDTRVSGGFLDYDTLDEYTKLFFRSDHHWNYDGAYQGYLDCLELLDADSDPRTPGQRRTNTKNLFRGSMARQSAYNRVGDHLFDLGIELPAYTVSINGGDALETVYPQKEGYLRGEYASSEFDGLYSSFFRYDFAEVAYSFPCNSTGRNLLIIGDSISNCIEDVIASHFDNTYSIDLRLNIDFRYYDYVAEHGITDVLFLNTLSSYITLSDKYGDRFTR